MSSDSQVKKMEEQLSEASRRGDNLQRTLTELSLAKNRLTGTLTDLSRSSKVKKSGGILLWSRRSWPWRAQDKHRGGKTVMLLQCHVSEF